MKKYIHILLFIFISAAHSHAQRVEFAENIAFDPGVYGYAGTGTIGPGGQHPFWVYGKSTIMCCDNMNLGSYIICPGIVQDTGYEMGMNYDENGTFFYRGQDAILWGNYPQLDTNGFFILRAPETFQQTIIAVVAPCIAATGDHFKNTFASTDSGFYCIDSSSITVWRNENKQPLRLGGGDMEGVFASDSDSLYYYSYSSESPVWSMAVPQISNLYTDNEMSVVYRTADTIYVRDTSGTLLHQFTVSGYNAYLKCSKTSIFLADSFAVSCYSYNGTLNWNYSIPPHDLVFSGIDTTGRLYMVAKCYSTSLNYCPFSIIHYPNDPHNSFPDFYACFVYDTINAAVLSIGNYSSEQISFVYCAGGPLDNSYGNPNYYPYIRSYGTGGCFNGNFGPGNMFIYEVATDTAFTSPIQLINDTIPSSTPEGDYFLRRYSTNPVAYSNILPIIIQQYKKVTITASSKKFCNVTGDTITVHSPEFTHIEFGISRNGSEPLTEWGASDYDSTFIIHSSGVYNFWVPDYAYSYVPMCLSHDYFTKHVTLTDTCPPGDSFLSRFSLIEDVAYPNPFYNELNISAGKQIDFIIIHDSQGRIIYKSESDGKIILNTSGWPTGLYTLSFIDITGKQSVMKIIHQ